MRSSATRTIGWRSSCGRASVSVGVEAGAVAAPFGKLWAVDGEFTRDDRHPGPVKPICLCAVEIISGRTIRVWEDELGGMKVPPFSIGPDSCLISYAAGAE